jgi:hypothetical protein
MMLENHNYKLSNPRTDKNRTGYRSKSVFGKTRFCFAKDQVVVPGKQPHRVRARSVLAYWAIRDLGLTATEVGKHLGLTKSAVSRAANRGQKLIVDQFLSLKE